MLRVIEVSWLIVVVTGLSLGGYKVCVDSFAESIYIFLLTSIAILIYLMRRKQRIEMEKRQQQE